MVEKCDKCGSSNIDEYGCIDCFSKDIIDRLNEKNQKDIS